MSRGRRYDGEPKLNIKKVVAVMLVIAVIIMLIIVIINLCKKGTKKVETKNITNSYISICSGNKWGVINSKGDYIINPTYDNMIIIPNSSKAMFICQDNVDLEKGTFSSYVIDEKSNKQFTNYENVEVIQNIDSNGQIFYDDNVLKVSKGGKYGLINYNGKELLECKYDSIEPVKYITKSFVIIKDGKKGLVDNAGNIIIENQYLDIQAISNKYEDGYIVKNDNSKFGLINYNKKQILDCKYTEIKHICGSNMYAVKEGQDLEIISSDGNVLLKNKFEEAISIDNKNVIFRNGDKYGIISSDGEIKLNAEYQYLQYIFDGNYIAKKENKYGIINLTGETKAEFIYTKMTYLKEEAFIEADKDTQTDLMDSNFTVKATGIVSEINSKLGYVKVRTNNGYKYYNLKLEEKSVQDVYPANTLFLSKENGKYGFINKNGVVVVNYIYDDATEQNEYGYAAVKTNGKWGAIDSAGKLVTNTEYSLAQNTVISFIGKWHLAPDLNANYYTDVKE